MLLYRKGRCRRRVRNYYLLTVIELTSSIDLRVSICEERDDVEDFFPSATSA